MRIPQTARAIVGVLATAALVAFAVADASGSEAGATPRTKLTFVAPAAAGGGWDLAAREAQQVLVGTSIVNNVQVVNIPGAGGTIGLAQFAQLDDDPSQVMVTGTVMQGAITVNDSAVTLDDLTPIARLADDYNALMVPADSPFETLDDLIAAWQQDPRGIAIGGGGLGGTDHLIAGLLAEEIGVAPGDVNYVSYAGGGEVLTSLLSHTVDVGISGYNEFSDQVEAGNLRALALSADEAVDGIDVPTFIDQGVEVSLPNWRGVMAPAGISEEQRDELIAIFTEMSESDEWQEVLERNRWEDTFMAGDEFAQFVEDDQARIDAIIEELGL